MAMKTNYFPQTTFINSYSLNFRLVKQILKNDKESKKMQLCGSQNSYNWTFSL